MTPTVTPGQGTPDLAGAKAALAAARDRAAAADLAETFATELDDAFDAIEAAVYAASAATEVAYFADAAEAEADAAYFADDADAARVDAVTARADAKAAAIKAAEAAEAAECIDTPGLDEAAYLFGVSRGMRLREAARRVSNARLRYERARHQVRRPPPSAPRYTRSNGARRRPSRQRTPRRARSSAPMRAGPSDGPSPDPDPALTCPRERGQRAQPRGCA